jgi:hypothetical protein
MQAVQLLGPSYFHIDHAAKEILERLSMLLQDRDLPEDSNAISD